MIGELRGKLDLSDQAWIGSMHDLFVAFSETPNERPCHE